MLCEGLTKEAFAKWNISHSHDFLLDCDINKIGNKNTSLNNDFNAYQVNLEVTMTNYNKEKHETERNCKEKLVSQNKLVKIIRHTVYNISIVYSTLQSVKYII